MSDTDSDITHHVAVSTEQRLYTEVPMRKKNVSEK